MSDLKELYSPHFYNMLSNALEKTVTDFDKEQFIRLIFSTDFEQKELKQRMRHTSTVVHEFMPEGYPEAIAVLYKLVDELQKMGFADQLASMFVPDYIEAYGLEHLEISMDALEVVTQFVSCEFAVRPFIIRYFDPMIARMVKWSTHASAKVRRLASEGSRPRLPWAMAIPSLKKDPGPILPILENLKEDPSESVRRSVANSLNDISKDNPNITLQIALQWKGLNVLTDAIIKHGCRTLLKQGHVEILAHYGLNSKGIELTGFAVVTPEVASGQDLIFHFTIKNELSEPKTVRLEYGVYFRKANGSLSRKVFKISERIYQPGEKVLIERKQSFRFITTRVYHPGLHQVSVIINGIENTPSDFELLPVNV